MNPNLLVEFNGFFPFLLLSGIILFSLERLVIAGTPKIEHCEPKSCGNVTDISYPFWLGGEHPSFCGLPVFQLSCDDGIPVLQQNKDFQVREIFYNNQSILFTDSTLANTDCPVPEFNFSFTLSPLTLSPANRNLSFYNCAVSIPGSYEVTCASTETVAYLDRDPADPGHLNLPSGCRTTVVPVLGYAGANSSDYKALLERGFLLEWTTPDCSECRESNGQCGYDTTHERFMCICSDRPHLNSCSGYSSKRRMVLIRSLSISMAGLLFLSLFFLLYLHQRKRSLQSITPWKKKSENTQNIEALLDNYGSLAPKRYKYSEIMKIAKSFREKLGQGGYGSVFKGSLQDGHLVAVKLLSDSKGNGEDFVNEVISISRTSHINIVSLVGFCLEGRKRALVYEYMPRGSLEKYIYVENPKATLGWEKLYEIAVGIARGLEYLHCGCNTRIVHFDIKPHNILLDQEFSPKISDFGLAKLSSPKDSILSMASARGTIGFIAPEVFSRSFGVVSTKSDVYSYGMVVLEMVGGRKNVKASVENSSEVYFPHWIYDHLDQDQDLQAWEVTTTETIEIAKKLILVGLWCIQTMPGNRPTMSKVIDMLEGSTNDLQMPPKPQLSSPLHSPVGSSSSPNL